MNRIFRNYSPELKKYRSWLMLVIVSMIFATCIDAVFPFLFGRFAAIISTEPTSESMATMRQLISLFSLSYVLSWIFRRTHDYAIIRFEARGMRDIEKRAFLAIQSQSARFFEDNFTGSLVKKAGRFVRSFESITDIFIFIFLSRGLQIFIMLGIFTIYAPHFGLLFLFWTILFLGGNIWYAHWKLKFDIKVAEADSKIGSAYTDSLGNHQAVRSYAKEGYEYNRVSEASNAFYELRFKSWRLNNIAFMVQAFLMLGLEYLLVLYMSQKWQEGRFSIEEYVIFQTYLLFLFTGLWDLGRNLRTFFTAYADANEMIDVLEQIPEVRDLPNAKTMAPTGGKIEFRQVSFSYDGKSPQFKDFELLIPARQKVAVVGHTGAGKSTITKLLFRFFDIQSGEILIDGQNIAEVTQNSLRRNISLVPQQPELFHRTIAENIGFAKPQASFDEIREAAKKAQALNFTEKLPNGFNTLVGERGVKLSGGEKQRVAIARAFLENAPILVLDEATSALDSITEKKIQQAIFELIENRTSIVIAHRLSTILRMDRIIVMEHGRIIEDGTHQELLAQKGAYAEMWNHQAGGFLDAD